jgi:hypothetical protein
MTKTGPRDEASLAAIRLEWCPRSNRNRWPPSSESAQFVEIVQAGISGPWVLQTVPAGGKLIQGRPPSAVIRTPVGRIHLAVLRKGRLQCRANSKCDSPAIFL